MLEAPAKGKTRSRLATKSYVYFELDGVDQCVGGVRGLYGDAAGEWIVLVYQHGSFDSSNTFYPSSACAFDCGTWLQLPWIVNELMWTLTVFWHSILYEPTDSFTRTHL